MQLYMEQGPRTTLKSNHYLGISLSCKYIQAMAFIAIVVAAAEQSYSK
jgi:hypothetical protein